MAYYNREYEKLKLGDMEFLDKGTCAKVFHDIELFDVYSDFNFLQLLENKLKLSSFVIDAYTARYYPDDSVNALLESKDYILDNFRELERLFEVFTQCSISTRDVDRKNAILSRSGIIIIDPDMFDIMSPSKACISINNKNQLMELFASILAECALNKEIYKQVMGFIDDEISKINITRNTDITYEISKKLKYVKRPIELFKR